MRRRSILLALTALATPAVSLAAPADAAPPIYYVLFHTPGPGWKPGVSFRDQPGIGDHVRYMSVIEAKGMLLIGGPFIDDSGGMMVLQVDSMGEAVRIAEADPTVRAGLLRVKVRPWLAALGGVKR
jgi:uncharacterized protein YciI